MKSLLENWGFNLIVSCLPKFKKIVQNSDVGVTMLLCHRDVKMGIFCLSSFFYKLGISLPVFIVDDGSLSKADKELLNRCFSVEIVDPKKADRILKTKLSIYPHVTEYRFAKDTYVLKRKLIDATMLHPFRKAILMDADMIFFEPPTEIKTWIKDDRNEVLYVAHEFIKQIDDEDSEITIRKFIYNRFGSKMDIYMSSGLICLPSKKIINLTRLDKIIEYISTVGLDKKTLAEQHMFPVLLGNSKMKLLDRKKYINLWLMEQYRRGILPGFTFLHYAYEVKNAYKKDAIKLSLKSNFMRN